MVLVLLIGGWCGARVMWWEDPFPPGPAAAAAPPAHVQVQPVAASEPAYRLAPIAWGPPPIDVAIARAIAWEELRMIEQASRGAGRGGGRVFSPRHPRSLMMAAPAFIPARPAVAAQLPGLAGSPQWRMDAGAAERDRELADRQAPPPFLPPMVPRPAAVAVAPGRWSLDAWAFWRQGSSAAPISQGRVPIYGASQAGAVLQYRLAPTSGHDPRLYARAYRALVPRGETDGALGGSLRPLARVPLRVAGEVRYTDAAAFSRFRPAAYAVTEIPPLRLPLRAEAELYVQGGWVGGPGATLFADAQASVTRELPLVARFTNERLRLRFGAGAWGGAQKDAQRADLGPTLRLDTRIGKVAARIAVDWRLRVVGDAAPGSGVAVTVAAGF